MADTSTTAILIVGAGPAGLATALTLAARGTAATLVGPAGDPGDTRTTALLDGSVSALRQAGAWEAASTHAAPLRVMAIVDATSRLMRAPPVSFAAGEIGLDAFGWNIANADLVAALEATAAAEPRIARARQRVVSVAIDASAVHLRLEDGSVLSGALAVAADGRRSPLREAAGIAVAQWRYPQAALALNVEHARRHRDVSTEFHTETGPFTLVPLPGDRSSLVWVMASAEAERRAALTDAALAEEIERQSHSLLGKIRIAGRRSVWPMAGLAATRLAGERVALVGEAAHVFPPIGAQGFNLTMRDIVALADAAAHAPDPGATEVLDAYATARRLDVAARTATVDLLNRSLLSGFLPLQGARGLGLHLLDRVGPLRRLAMRQGLATRLGS